MVGSSAFPATDGPLWLVGCGAMGGSLLARWLEAGLDPATVVVVDPEPRGLPPGFGGAVVALPADAPEPPALLVLGVKPQQLPLVAPPLREAIGRGPLLVSMLAGVRTATLAQMLPGARVARIMPNLPARIGRGVTALYAAGLAEADAARVEWLARAAGAAVWLDDEQRFDVVTAVSGSGPAFLFRFIEALAGAAEAAGLERDMAAELALETVTGAAALVQATGVPPAQLRQQVTSPNGTTQAGLDVLDGDGALSSLLRATIRAAAERARALALAAESAADAPREAARAGS
jgi:pyrroline-5-carboxylate reductase